MTYPASCDRLTGWRASGCADRLARRQQRVDHAVHARGRGQYPVEVVVANAIEHAAVVFLEDAREALDHADRRAQVVRHRVAEGGLLAEQLGGFAFQRQARRHRGGIASPTGGGTGGSTYTGGADITFELAFAVETRHATQPPVAIGGRATGRTATSPSAAIDSSCARRPPASATKRSHSGCPPQSPCDQASAGAPARRLQPHQAVVAIGLPLPDVEQLRQQLGLSAGLAQRLAVAGALMRSPGAKAGQCHPQQGQAGNEPNGNAGRFAGHGHARDCKERPYVALSVALGLKSGGQTPKAG